MKADKGDNPMSPGHLNQIGPFYPILEQEFDPVYPPGFYGGSGKGEE
jgi:hypothetical protein